MLTFYELDLGLNHVVRKWSEETDRGANKLVPGALLCNDDPRCDNGFHAFLLLPSLQSLAVRTALVACSCLQKTG